MKKNILILIFLIVSVLSFNQYTFCEENVVHEQPTHEIKASDEGEHVQSSEVSTADSHAEVNVNRKHEASSNHEEQGIHEAPIEYYILWSIAIFIIITLFGYYMKLISVKGVLGSRIASDDLEHIKDIETTGFALMLVVLAIGFFTVLNLPELFGYFDSTTHTFVNGYHESTGTGLLRFIIISATGVLMTVYAFLGMHNH